MRGVLLRVARTGAGAMPPIKNDGATHVFCPPHKDTIRDIKKIINLNFKSNFSIVLEISRLFHNFEIFFKNFDLKYSIFLIF